MERIIVIASAAFIIATVLFVACNTQATKTEELTKRNNTIREYCHKGVTVWRHNGNAFIALDTNSKIIPCKEIIWK